MSTENSVKTPHIHIFDQLRGLSIIFIVMYHYVLEVSHLNIRPQVASFSDNLKTVQIFSGGISAFIANTITALFSVGWQFVGIFLFLSGFGLTYSRLTSSKKKTYIDRVVKLIPNWHIAIIFAFICNIIGHKFFPEYLVQNISVGPSHYFFLLLFPLAIDFSFAHIPVVNSSLWFIVLIVQFYFAFEFLFIILNKFGPYRFLLISLAITLVYRAIVIYFLHQQPGSLVPIEGRGANLIAMLPSRLFECSLGMFWAYLLYQGKDLLEKIDLKYVVLGFLCFILGNISNWSHAGWILSDTLSTIGLVILGCVLVKQITNRRVNAIILSVSNASFIIYLLHDQLITQIITPITFILSEKSGQKSLAFLGLALFLLTIIIASSLVHKKIIAYTKKALSQINETG